MTCHDNWPEKYTLEPGTYFCWKNKTDLP